MKKLISTFLIGALVITSMGMLNSCKDYDDDIDDLQGQITDLQSLQSTVETLQNTVASVKTTADNALAKANENATSIEEVKALANSYAEQISEAVEAAAAAQKSAEDAAADAKAAKDSADKALDEALKAYDLATQNVAKLESTIALADSLSNQLNLLAKKVADANANVDELKKVVESYTGSINEIYSSVTSVELFGSYNGNPGNLNDLDGPLTLMHGLVPMNSIFGDNETYAPSDPLIEFTKGDDISTEASLLVRVNPANADITNADIKLINSKGEVLDYVVAGTPVRFNELITRGTIGTSLWKIPFKVADGQNITKKMFNAATKKSSANILYAVAINNTPSDSTRYALSTFDVDPEYEDYENTTVLDFKVDDKNVAEIHNRWDGSQTMTEDAVKTDANIKEYKWAASTDDYPTPAVAMDEDHNVTDDTEDARYAQPLLPVKVGTPFVVDLTVGADVAKIKNYYVALDSARAIESIPSEWNAWNKYEYEGLFTTVASSDKLSITINSAEANGDIIGFRVFAVNYDGTLVDPDGRAFYVQVGDAANSAAVSAYDTVTTVNAGITDATTLLAATENTVVIPLPEDKSFAATAGDEFTPNASGTLTLTQATSGNMLNGEQVWYMLLDKDVAATTDWSKAKYIKVGVNNGGNWKDGSSVSGTITATSQVTIGGTTVQRVVNTLTVTVTKVLPTSNNTILRFRPTQGDQLTGKFTLYMVPDNGWAAEPQSTTGSIDLDNTFYELPENIVFTFDKSDVNAAGTEISKATEDGIVYGATMEDDHVLYQLKKQFIDSKTYHDVVASVNYGKISTATPDDDYMITLSQDLQAKFACWASANTYKWDNDTTWVDDAHTQIDTIVSCKPVITWTASGEYDPTDISSDVVVVNSYDATRFSGDLDVLIGDDHNYFTVEGTQLTWVDGTGQKQINPYLTPTYADGQITWARTQEENSVTEDHDENLEITVVDCYGHKEVITLAVTIKKATN
jgi:multidrug efflux pump subunit AcrA (membrane-fusion protein)